MTERDPIVSISEDLLAEGDPEKEFNPGIASRLPRKRVAAGVVFRDEDSRILVVEPVYKPGLEIPGGIVDENESPLQACIREVREELGIDPPIGDLLVVDWVPRHGVWPDGIMFVFDGGVLPREQLGHVRLQADELSAIKYLTMDEIEPNVRPAMARRLRACFEALALRRPLYLTFGRASDRSIL